MIVKQVPVGSMANFTYIIADEKSMAAAVIDPSWDLEKILDALRKDGLKPQYIINTHSHFDHVLGNEQLKVLTGAKIIMHKNARLERDVAVDDGDTINVGGLNISIMHTPGHSKDSICLLVEKKIFTGDTLFVGNCGRVDLPGGNASELYDSLSKLAKLDDDIEVYPGHDYGSTSHSTIGDERRNNHVLKPRSREEFMLFIHSDG